MELPPSQGGFFVPGTPSGTRFGMVLFPAGKDIVTGDEMGVLGILRVTSKLLKSGLNFRDLCTLGMES